MLQKIVAVFILICHVNSSMFLPQVAEQDIFNINGQQEDDINTVFEYVDQIILGHIDNTPEDEDDDSGQNLHLLKDVNYLFHPFFSPIEAKIRLVDNKRTFCFFPGSKIPNISIDIISPPPDFSAAGYSFI